MKEQLEKYFITLGKENNLFITDSFLKHLLTIMVDRLAEGKLLEDDFTYLKQPHNLLTKQVLKNVFGIKIMKSKKRNLETLQAFTNGENKPEINKEELANPKKPLFVKPKLKEHQVYWVSIGEHHGSEYVYFRLESETFEFGQKYALRFEEIEKERGWEIKHLERKRMYRDSYYTSETETTDKFNSMDVKFIKEELKKNLAVELKKRKLKNMFKSKR
jgi:hypothetical protein